MLWDNIYFEKLEGIRKQLDKIGQKMAGNPLKKLIN